MDRWILVKVAEKDEMKLKSLLKLGYEPFAVTADAYGDTIWFKKKVSE